MYHQHNDDWQLFLNLLYFDWLIFDGYLQDERIK